MDALEYVAGLRAFADWVEENAEGLEWELDREDSLDFLMPALNRADFARYARMLGRGEKRVDEVHFFLERRFGPVRAYAYVSRELVCERKVVATREITKLVPDPEQVALVPMVEVTEKVEDVEWVCDPAILAGNGNHSIRVDEAVQ